MSSNKPMWRQLYKILLAYAHIRSLKVMLS